MNGYNFSERVRKVLAMAREESVRLRHEYVGTEHILLGLIREGEGTAMAVLRNMSIDLAVIFRSAEERPEKGKGHVTTGPDRPYTSRAKKVLELAMSEARDLNHSYVGTEHLLLGLLREEKGIAAQVLNEAGVWLETTRTATLRLLSEGPLDWPTSLAAATPHSPPQRRWRAGRQSDGDAVTRPGPFGASQFADISWLVGPGRFSARVIAILVKLYPNIAGGSVTLRPEDLLLAVLEAGGTATAALLVLGVDIPELTAAVAGLREANRAVIADGPRGKSLAPDDPIVRVFWHSASLAAHDDSRPRGTDHLLLAILSETSGPACEALAAHGVTRERLREVVDRIIE